MRNALLLSFILASSIALSAQAPAGGAPAATPRPTASPAQAKPAPAPAQAKPAPAQPRATTAARGAQAAGRSGIALTVTDLRGAPLPGIAIELSGPTTRVAETSAGGQATFPGLQAGTYRLRFSGEPVTAFEREVTLTAGRTVTLDISLSPAPPPREIIKEVAAPAAPPPPPSMGPLGEPQALSLYDLAEAELKSKQPRREVLVACSGNLRTSLVTLTKEDLPQRNYQGAEASFYVLGGEAIVRVEGKERTLQAGGYATIPRGVPFTIGRRGNKALSLLSVLSGEPCEEAR
jgi:mannose-6-phosphate isomerase-like protein (cupin superfamily)